MTAILVATLWRDVNGSSTQTENNAVNPRMKVEGNELSLLLVDTDDYRLSLGVWAGRAIGA